MGDMSEMMLGMSASDLFQRDCIHTIRHEPLEEDPDDPCYLPTEEDMDLGRCMNFGD